MEEFHPFAYQPKQASQVIKASSLLWRAHKALRGLVYSSSVSRHDYTGLGEVDFWVLTNTIVAFEKTDAP